MEFRNNNNLMKKKINERNRTDAERRDHCLRMTDAVAAYLHHHFNNGGTLAQLRNDGDPGKDPEVPGQHGSISIVRLPLPASEDGRFVIKDLGMLQKDTLGNVMEDSNGNIYTIEARDLWAEASALTFLSQHSDIPVPWVYSCCAADERDPEFSFFTMEYIEGTTYHARLRLTDNQKNRIIRQMATIRIRMLEITSKAVGGMGWPTQNPNPNPNPPHPVGAMSGPRIWDDGRVRFISTWSFKFPLGNHS